MFMQIWLLKRDGVVVDFLTKERGSVVQAVNAVDVPTSASHSNRMVMVMKMI